MLLAFGPVCCCVGGLAWRVGARTSGGAAGRRPFGRHQAEVHLKHGAAIDDGLSGSRDLRRLCVLARLWLKNSAAVPD